MSHYNQITLIKLRRNSNKKLNFNVGVFQFTFLFLFFGILKIDFAKQMFRKKSFLNKVSPSNDNQHRKKKQHIKYKYIIFHASFLI